jgi:hypothetical protein
MPRRRRKERYIDRWLKEHPRLTLYLTKEEYDAIKEMAAFMNMTVRDLVVETIKELSARWRGRPEKGGGA